MLEKYSINIIKNRYKLFLTKIATDLVGIKKQFIFTNQILRTC